MPSTVTMPLAQSGQCLYVSSAQLVLIGDTGPSKTHRATILARNTTTSLGASM